MTTPNTLGLIQTASETGSPAKINLEVGQEMATGATSLHITGLMKWPKPAILKLYSLLRKYLAVHKRANAQPQQSAWDTINIEKQQYS